MCVCEVVDEGFVGGADMLATATGRALDVG